MTIGKKRLQILMYACNGIPIMTHRVRRSTGVQYNLAFDGQP